MEIGESSKILSGAKLVYLVFFFALLSGMFYPVITHSSSEPVIEGVLILFVGLAGGLSLYKAGTAERHQKKYLIIGFAILSLAMFLVYLVLGKI